MVEPDVGALLLEALLWLGWLVCMYGFVYDFPLCWPWVGSRVGWMDGLILCLGFCWARVAVENIAIILLLEIFLWLGWVVFMHGFVYDFPMCWPWVGSTVGWMDGLILCLGFCCARVAVEQNVRVVLLETFLWLGWVVFMYGVVLYFLMCWPLV